MVTDEKQGVCSNSEHTPPPVRLCLQNISTTRRTYARLIKAYHEHRIDEHDFKVLLWALQGFLAYHKAELDIAMGERLDELESKLDSIIKKNERVI